MDRDSLSGVLTAIPIPALVIDANERILASNTEARTLLGQQIDGRHFATILRQPEVADAIEASLRDRQPRQARFLDNDGAHDTTFDVFVRPMGASPDILLSFQDVTQMEQAGQMRRDFVANVSHELRTPLTALIGFIETLRGAAADDPKARERFLGIMEGEAGRMNRLVGDLLSLSRVESQERVRPREAVDLSGLLQSVLNSLKPLGEQDDVSFSLDLPESQVLVPGDADQLRQVFTNLAENAIKYGGSGGVLRMVLSVSDRDPALRAPAARVLVIDQGPGIDPLHLPRLTERFYRADSHRSRQLGGTGLGLAIVKHIVNRHRGRLRVESELGEGATFTVILPLSQ
ncbi:MAG: ATP-binding protein [Arenibacterium sp.]